MRYLKPSFFSPYVPWRLLSMLFLLALATIIYAINEATILAKLGHPGAKLYIEAVLSIVCPTFVGLLCLRGSLRYLRRSASSGAARSTRRFSPLLWALCGFTYAIGQVAWFWQLLVTHQIPSYPSTAYFIEFLPYLSFIAAILFLPAQSISGFARLRILVDSLIIMAAVTTLCYYFVLEPLLGRGDGTLGARLTGGLYAVLDLLALFSVLMVALRSGERVLRPVLFMLGLATMLKFAVNILRLYEMLYNSYNEFSVASVSLTIYGAMLVGSAQTVNAILCRSEEASLPVVQQDDETPSIDKLWKMVLPWVLVLAFGLLVLAIWLNGGQVFHGQMIIVYVGGFVVLILTVLSQFLTMYYIEVLQKKLRVRNHSLGTLNTRLEKQATADPLTDLPNHRALAEKLDEILVWTRKTGTVCSVIFMDIDHFKDINDSYGHLVGDLVLGHFAQVVTSAVGAEDAVGRWGGEEFVAILPETEAKKAFQVAERIRLAVSMRTLTSAGTPDLTCSLGVATYPEDADECEDLLKQADSAMYTAKCLGRNQTRTARESLALAEREAVPMVKNCKQASMCEVAEVLLMLVEARDPSLVRHARRVAVLSSRLAQEFHLSQAETQAIRLSGLLHNLGVIALPDEVLSGHDGEGLEKRAGYAVIGVEILASAPVLHEITEIVRFHREWMDGSGYPAGLRGAEIPLGARIVAVANAYEIAAGERFSCQERTSAILAELRRAAGVQFDPQVVEALAHIFAVPAGLSRVDVAWVSSKEIPGI